MYCHDNQDRLPPHGQPAPGWQSCQYGGSDPGRPGLPLARERPLRDYVFASKAFRCAADRGGAPWTDGFPDTFTLTGTSYVYNWTPWWAATRFPPKPLAEQPAQSVHEPGKFVLLYEWPALPYSDGRPFTWTIWHGLEGPSTLHSAKDIHQKVVATVLFVDGHAKVHDFTESVKSSGPAEPNRDWVWYEPAQ
jgi:prepilin-type processing-associated H-X9-DG protein